MPSLLQIQNLLFLLLVTFGLAAPSPAHAPIQKRSFKVERVANPNFVRSPGAGTRALIKAHRKYSVPLPPGLMDAMNTAQPVQSEKAPGTNSDALGGGLLAGLEGALSGLGGGGGGAGATKPKDTPATAAAGAGKAKGTGKAGTAKASGKAGTAKASGKAGTAKASGKAGTAKGSGKAGTAKATNAAGTAQPSGAPAKAAGNSTGGGGTGSVAATPEPQDVEYLSPVIIGGQTMNMDFDSGSSDLWVFNSQLPAASQKNHQIFDTKKSTTLKMMAGATFNISYGDGSGAAGNVGTDVVNIGGATVTAQAIELATAVSASFVADQANNGLVGLAFSKLNTIKPAKQKTFFDNAMPTLAEPVFTADLRHNAVGAYEFGRIDAAKFTGALKYTAVNTTQGFWQFPSAKFSVGNGPPMVVAGGQAIADTGTTLMLVNPAVVNAYYSQVTGAVNDAKVGGVTFPCNSVMPDLNVAVGNNMALIRGTDINFAKVDANGTSCFGGVQAIAGSLQIYGDIMFKSQFVVFNGGNNSIGMAPHQ